RVLEWLYSFSLAILLLFTLALVVVTPVDVIIQTQGALSLGLKLFIIIGAHALFLFLALVYYFSRLFNTRVLINQIPAKSVYLPLEPHDLPEPTRAHITANLRRCLGDIRVRAGPLNNPTERFDYAGRAPPLYIQQRNVRLGFANEISGLPENCVFQDVVNSIGLKIKADGLFAGSFTIPRHYTFREIILAMVQEIEDEGHLDDDLATTARLVVAAYERFKFGRAPIRHADLTAFLARLEQLMNI
ncbi:hypothetical protein METBIDRAFT_16974, partial [Metschnikowia bicuspidata var. bicuspidata NRRL YB-4993]